MANDVQEFIMNDVKTNVPNVNGNSNANHSESHGLPGHDVSISFVGTSLGGLYAKYALSQIPHHLVLNTEAGTDMATETEGSNVSHQINLIRPFSLGKTFH